MDRSTIDVVWDLIWTQSHRSEVQTLKTVFEPYLDLDERIQDKGFSTLHRIVLGLSPIDLKAQLQTSTADIDLPCSRGRTPLHYGVQQSNTELMKTLLEFGASVHLQDRLGRAPLYCIASRGTTEALEILLAAISSGRCTIPNAETQVTTRDNMITTSNPVDDFLKFCLEQRTIQGFTALTICAFYKNRTELVRMLLNAGADVDSTQSPWSTPVSSPLHFAIQQSEHATMKLLLEKKARLDLYDEDMQGTLHYVAVFGDLDTIPTIAREDKVQYLDAEHKDAFDYTPLQAFDIMRPKFHPEDESIHQQCRQAFLHLLSRTRNGPEYIAPKMSPAEDIGSEDSDDGGDVFYEFEEPD